MIKSKLNLFLWFLMRPKFYRELLSLFHKRLWQICTSNLTYKKDKTATRKWCEERAISTEEALFNLTKEKKKPVKMIYGECFREAKQVESKCPCKMGGEGDLDLLYHLSESVQSKRIIETGVAYGWSSLVFLLSLNKRGGRLISTDMPYPGRGNDNFVGCVVPETLKSRWRLLRYPDRQILPKILKKGKYDLCHYDSDKSYFGRNWAYPKLWKGLRKGGVFISDDVGDNRAFIDFCKKIGRIPMIVKKKNKYIGFLIK